MLVAGEVMSVLNSRASLRILLDTNVVIAAESTAENLHPNASLATELYRLVTELGHMLCVGAGTQDDISRHKDVAHKANRRQQLKRYHVLERTVIPEGFQSRAGYPPKISEQSKVDLSLLLLLDRGAAQWLVTEDTRILPHARALGLEDRVFSLTDALDVLGRQRQKPVSVPAVQEIKGYQLDPADAIFDDFAPEYRIREWLREKVAAEARPCLVMQQPGDSIDALAILKGESDEVWNLPGKVLKVCTFKVAARARGVKRGELLLWAVFQHARANDYDSAFVEVFDHEAETIALFQSFGFSEAGTTSRPNELVLGKRFLPESGGASDADPFEFNVEFGPGALAPDRWFVVPIMPKWHASLFPVADDTGQLTLYDGITDQGNAIRKAYVCHSSTKQLRRGDTLLFLRTRESPMAAAVGVVEDTLRSSDPVEVLSFTGRRTVYTPNEIASKCAEREVLAIRFRLDRVLDAPVTSDELIEHGVMARSPMSVLQVKSEEGASWLTSLVTG